MGDVAEERPVWAWIDLEALRHNARRALAAADGRAVIGVVKADGYGHGAVDVARSLLAEGVTRLAVVSVAEGAALRRGGIGAPILLMGGLDSRLTAARALKWSLTPVLHDRAGLELARAVARPDSPLDVEVEVDTGMHRMGIPADRTLELLAEIDRTPEVHLTGLYTHLACADEADSTASRDQLDVFAPLVAALARGRAGGGRGSDRSGLAIHFANSAGLLRIHELEGARSGPGSNAARPGIMLYGVSPFADRTGAELDLRPVMTLAAQVVAIRRVARGGAVGYGGEWRAPRETVVATLPLGYADGIPRAVLGRGEVHLGGALRPIVGRVSMDYIGVDIGADTGADIGESGVQVGDVATVFGRTPEGVIVPVERLARAAGTIGYEILVGIGARVPRRFDYGPPTALRRVGRTQRFDEGSVGG